MGNNKLQLIITQTKKKFNKKNYYYYSEHTQEYLDL